MILWGVIEVSQYIMQILFTLVVSLQFFFQSGIWELDIGNYEWQLVEVMLVREGICMKVFNNILEILVKVFCFFLN